MPATDSTADTDQPDSLTRNVIQFSAWVLVLIGFLFAVLYGFDPIKPANMVWVNIVTGLIGLGGLLLFRQGRIKLAVHWLVWGIFGAISYVVWYEGGLQAATVDNYSALLVVSAWLLGRRPTGWLFALISATLFCLHFAGESGWLPQTTPEKPEMILLYLHVFLFGIAGLSLLSRRSYELRLADIAHANRILSEKEAELRKLSLAVAQSPEGVMITDLDGQIEYVNDAFVKSTGYAREEVLGRNPSLLQSGQTPPETYQAMWSHLKQGLPWRGELLNRRKDGSMLIESNLISPIRTEQGTVTSYIAIKQDITEIRAAFEKIHRLTNFDHLTDLPNRHLLLDRLAHALALFHRQSGMGALVLVNIDRFKVLNEARSWADGDRLLVAFGQRMAHLLHCDDTLARLSGDEFGILLENLGHTHDEAGQQAMAVVRQISDGLRVPFTFGGGDEVTITASIGVAVCPKTSQDTVTDILRRADTALHRAKDGGGGRIEFFDPAMTERAEHRFGIERELRQAIRAGELRLYLQPQVDARGCWVSAEALVRWQHPQRGLLSPDVFIPIAEESDLIMEVDAWVISQACTLIASQDALGTPLNLSMNVSPRHFAQPDFVARIRQLLHITGATASRVTLEVTEGLVIKDIRDVIAKMNELNACGIRFSVDDFGTGYSSLAYLKRLPIHELKIDKAFIQDTTTDADDAALVEAILSVARHMHLQVVAEGVETEAQAAFLNAHGDVTHQGYLFGRPQPAETWIDWLHQGHTCLRPQTCGQ